MKRKKIFNFYSLMRIEIAVVESCRNVHGLQPDCLEPSTFFKYFPDSIQHLF